MAADESAELADILAETHKTLFSIVLLFTLHFAAGTTNLFNEEKEEEEEEEEKVEEKLPMVPTWSHN